MLAKQVGVFYQKQYIKDKITIASLKNISENKILKWTEIFGWDNTKKSGESLIFIVVPLVKLVFIEKVKKKIF